MNANTRRLILVATLSGLYAVTTCGTALAQRQADEAALADALALQVSDTARSETLSRGAKATLVASSVRAALSAVLASATEWPEMVNSAANLAVRSIQAAPELNETIIQAALSVPRIANRPELAEAVEEAIRNRLVEEPEIADAAPSPRVANLRPLMEFSGSRSEAIVSPATLKKVGSTTGTTTGTTGSTSGTTTGTTTGSTAGTTTGTTGTTTGTTGTTSGTTGTTSGSTGKTTGSTGTTSGTTGTTAGSTTGTTTGTTTSSTAKLSLSSPSAS